MKTNKWAIRGLVAVANCLIIGSASAGPVVWTNWTSLSTDLKTASGMMGGVAVRVEATRAMDGVSQLTGAGNCSTNYWTEPLASDRPYTGGSISNAPTACEQIGLNSTGQPASNNTLTVTFASAVDVLYMALLSVGQPGVVVTYDFDTAFSIDSEGQGFWGNDATNGITGAGDTLTMREFHGVLRFAAPVTSFTVVTGPENWQAFTFGMSVPEPGSLALVGAALLGVGAASRRRKVA